jgi:hypothetical protein
MNSIYLRITLNDGTVIEVKTSAGDLVKWESHFDISIANLEKTTHLLYLAWLTVTRLAKTALAFEQWIELVDTVEVDDTKK